MQNSPAPHKKAPAEAGAEGMRQAWAQAKLGSSGAAGLDAPAQLAAEAEGSASTQDR